MFEREEELAPAELTVPVQCMTGREAIRNTLVSDELGDFAWNKLYKRELFRDIRYPLGRMMEDQGTTYRIFSSAARSYTARCHCIITISARTASFTAGT